MNIKKFIKTIKQVQLARINIDDPPLFKKGHWYFYDVEYGMMLSPVNFREYYFWLGATKIVRNKEVKVITLGNTFQNIIHFLPALHRYLKQKI